MISVFEILYFGIWGVRIRGGHYGNECESEMATQATSKEVKGFVDN